MTPPKKRLIMYNGRRLGQNLYYHHWFRNMIPTLKVGWTMGIPLEEGIAIFEFKGIRKPKSPKIIIEGCYDPTH